MRIRKTIKENIEIIRVPMTLSSKALYIQTALSKCVHVHIYVYNPDHEFVAELIHGPYGISEHVIIGEHDVMLNGLSHKIKEGPYLFEIYVLESLKSPIDIEITYTSDVHCLEEVKENMDKSVFQSETWFSELYDKKVHNRACRYYKGDLHGHTTYSDGHLNGDEAISIMKKQHLDYMAMTEHNRCAFGYKLGQVLMIPSFELTLQTGHLNIHGIKHNQLFKDMNLTMNMHEMIEILKKEHEDCHVSLNHMFLDEWAYTDTSLMTDDISAIELICDPTYPTSKKANGLATGFLDFLWNKGHKIFGVGGSDSHNRIDELYKGSDMPSIYGDPATYIHCDGLSVEHLIASLKSGHTYVSRYHELKIDMSDYLPGDEIKESFIYHVAVKGIKKTCMGRFILNGKVVKEVALDKDESEMSFDTAYIADERWWLRFGLYDGDEVIAYINPVYKNLESSSNVRMDTLIEEFLNDKRHTV